jgi:hypothetical protein
MKSLQVLSWSSLVLFAVPLFAQGCASTVDATPAADAAVATDATKPDAATDAGRDAGRPVQDAAPAAPDACVPGPSIVDAGIPDAAIGTDAGGNVGQCAACILAACPSEIAACDAECECNLAANDLFDCLNAGQSALVCGQQIAGGASPALQDLGACAFAATQCRTPCGVGGAQ